MGVFRRDENGPVDVTVDDTSVDEGGHVLRVTGEAGDTHGRSTVEQDGRANLTPYNGCRIRQFEGGHTFPSQGTPLCHLEEPVSNGGNFSPRPGG